MRDFREYVEASNQPDPEEMTQLQEKDAAVLRAITRKHDASEVVNNNYAQL